MNIRKTPSHSNAGFALYLFQYSTWKGRPALYLENQFVREAFRKLGVGTAVLREWLNLHMTTKAIQNLAEAK